MCLEESLHYLLPTEYLQILLLYLVPDIFQGEPQFLLCLALSMLLLLLPYLLISHWLLWFYLSAGIRHATPDAPTPIPTGCYHLSRVGK